LKHFGNNARINIKIDMNKIKLGITIGDINGIGLEVVLKTLADKRMNDLFTPVIYGSSGFEYPGHTEYLAKELGNGKNLMLMVNDDLRIGLVTNHVPVSEVAGKISKEAIAKKIKLMSETLQMDFGITKPNIAVLGLNPHAGDGGAIGKEEADIIRPAVLHAKKNGVMAFGPFPADGFFGSAAFAKYDGILAMYHDQ